MITLEKYEWTNAWWDEPSSPGKRVLLVGDSITNAYRSHVKELTGDRAYVDMTASSRALDNPAFLKELRHMLDLSEYCAVHFNNGLHGFHLSSGMYEERYDAAINYIRTACPAAKIIVALSTPITLRDNPGLLSEKENATVIERNEAASRIAERYGLPVNDLYSLVCGDAGIKSGDGYHFNAEGQKLQARQVADFILKAIDE